MEEETHSDPAVANLASQYVCVKVDAIDSPLLAEEYNAFSYPRTLILTPDNKRITECIGYEAAEEHRKRLLRALTALPSLDQSDGAIKTHSVGASQERADLVFWFIEESGGSSVETESDDHIDLLSCLREAGFRPRLEHIVQEDLTESWANATNRGSRPDFLVTSHRLGLMQSLMQNGTTHDVISSRLRNERIPSICDDFERKWIWRVQGSPNAERADLAVWHLFNPPPHFLSGASEFAAPDSLRNLAKAAAQWYVSGDLAKLRPLWDANAPQRQAVECDEVHWRRGLDVWSDGIRLFGNKDLALAMVETRASGTNPTSPYFVSEATMIGSPSVILLRRNDRGLWRVLLVGMLDLDVVVDDLARLLSNRWDKPDFVPTESIKRMDLADRHVDCSGDSLRWQVPDLNADAFNMLVRTNYRENGWPASVLVTMLPAGKLSGSIPIRFKTRSTVQLWTITSAGAMSFSNLYVHAGDSGK